MALSKEEYIEIRHAQANGARHIDDILKMTSIVADTPEKMKEIEDVLYIACRCKGVSVEAVAIAVQSGADSVEKIQELTEAGTVCGRCIKILEDILKRGH